MTPTLTDKEFKSFSQMMFDMAGINLTEAKKPLVSGRLAKRLAQHALDSYGDYFKLIQADKGERQMALDLLTTNETYFFREPKHFEFLAQTVAPAMRAQSPLRVWCGASSTGEEPYTIAMTLAESLGHMRFDILASDISSRVLQTAEQALYPMEDAEDIPRALRAKYCLNGVGSQQGRFLIDKPIRERVRFESINLCAPLPDLGSFDIIFLRNVMIYFTMETKRQVVARLLPLLRPGGYFFISHSESLHGVTDQLQLVKPSIYFKHTG